MDERLNAWRQSFKVSGSKDHSPEIQPELFPLEITNIYPHNGRGTDVAFIADAGSGRYYCKRDISPRKVRAAEWICTSLATYLNIPVPDFAFLRTADGETLFGSREEWDTASQFEAETFLTSPTMVDPAIGDPHAWLGPYLSKLYAFDLFVSNPDRQICNFLLSRDAGTRRLLAFDFAASNLADVGSANFSIARTNTLFVGRRWRAIRRFDSARAGELLDWLADISLATIEGIVEPMPADWLSSVEREKFLESWSSGASKIRLDALRRGLSDGTLL
jgi:hypothetical protein